MLFVNQFTSNINLIGRCKDQEEAVSRAAHYYKKQSTEEIQEFIAGSFTLILEQKDKELQEKVPNTKKRKTGSWFMKKDEQETTKKKKEEDSKTFTKIEPQKLVNMPLFRKVTSDDENSLKEFLIFLDNKILDNELEAMVEILKLNLRIMTDVLQDYHQFSETQLAYKAIIQRPKAETSDIKKKLEVDKRALCEKLQQFIVINSKYNQALKNASSFLSEEVPLDKVNEDFNKVKKEIIPLIGTLKTSLKSYHKILKQRMVCLYNTKKDKPSRESLEEAIILECLNLGMPLEMTVEALNLATLEESDLLPFDLDGMIQIFKIFKGKEVAYYPLEVFAKYSIVKNMKPWNLIARIKYTLLTFFPVLIITNQNHQY